LGILVSLGGSKDCWNYSGVQEEKHLWYHGLRQVME
jgi:hypothetical protein